VAGGRRQQPWASLAVMELYRTVQQNLCGVSSRFSGAWQQRTSGRSRFPYSGTTWAAGGFRMLHISLTEIACSFDPICWVAGGGGPVAGGSTTRHL
jgi:hypothetical protein